MADTASTVGRACLPDTASTLGDRPILLALSGIWILAECASTLGQFRTSADCASSIGITWILLVVSGVARRCYAGAAAECASSIGDRPILLAVAGAVTERRICAECASTLGDRPILLAHSGS